MADEMVCIQCGRPIAEPLITVRFRSFLGAEDYELCEMACLYYFAEGLVS